MWRRVFTAFKSIQRPIVSASVAATIITGIENDKTQRISSNRILSDKHRIALAEWPVICADMDNDARVNTLDALISYLQKSDYDGIEMSFENFKSLYFKDSNLSKTEIINTIKHKFDNSQLRIFGILLHSKNEDWSHENADKYLNDLDESLSLNRSIGAEYVTFQLWLPEKYMTNDGSYRNDDALLNEYVQRIECLQQICYENGLNFYVETHVGRISEDPEAFIKIMDRSDTQFELNGDLSHYICRGMMNGPYVDKILSKMEHAHVRMARIYGDLSVNVEDPMVDWNDPGGVTRTNWEFTKKGLENGLSSRVIVGESGPMHLVDDPLKQDQRMVPLLRAMADYCDKQIAEDDSEKETLNPFAACV